MLDDDLAVLVNAWWEPLDFVLPDAGGATGGLAGEAAGGGSWTVQSDSYEPANRGTVHAARPVRVGPRSLVLVLLNRNT